jgi:hypothetical protein
MALVGDRLPRGLKFGQGTPRATDQSVDMDGLTGELEREFRSLWESLNEAQNALRILLLGLDYRRYVRFRTLTPEVYHVMATPSHRLGGSRDGSVALTANFVSST